MPNQSQLDRIEAKLDALLAALAAEGEDDEAPDQSLDGVTLGRERDQSQAL